MFFTKQEIGPSSESTHAQSDTKGVIFISTGKGADSSDLTHGLIHALGIATNRNGFSNYPAAETVTKLTEARLKVGTVSYRDDRPPPRTYGPITISYVKTVFDVLRDGARKYQ